MTAETTNAARPQLGLSLRQFLPGWIGLCLIALLAWIATIAWAGSMGVGAGTMGMSIGPFLGVWVVMMAAMMLPSVAPMAIVWIQSVASRPRRLERVLGIISFLAGYLFAWTAFGAVVYVVLLGADSLANEAPNTARWVGAGIFALAGVYQLTPLKGACLRHCRSPLGSLFHYASYRGRGRDFRVGLHHGFYCVGCCWGLMIVLIAVGAMNVPAMVVLAGVILIEKVWRFGRVFSRFVGIALLFVAALAPFIASLLPGLTMVPAPGM